MKIAIQTLGACHDSAVAGGKAVGLARLLQAGFRVPPGLCITTETYQEMCTRAGIHPQLEWENLRDLTEAHRKDGLSTIRARLTTYSWPAQWSLDLEQALAKISTGFPSSWAVRSSATNEDAAAASGERLDGPAEDRAAPRS